VAWDLHHGHVMKQTLDRGTLYSYPSVRIWNQGEQEPDMNRVLPSVTAWAIFYAIAIAGALISARPAALTAVAAVNGATSTINNR
jgi:hypothetical protein